MLARVPPAVERELVGICKSSIMQLGLQLRQYVNEFHANLALADIKPYVEIAAHEYCHNGASPTPCPDRHSPEVTEIIPASNSSSNRSTSDEATSGGRSSDSSGCTMNGPTDSSSNGLKRRHYVDDDVIMDTPVVPGHGMENMTIPLKDIKTEILNTISNWDDDLSECQTPDPLSLLMPGTSASSTPVPGVKTCDPGTPSMVSVNDCDTVFVRTLERNLMQSSQYINGRWHCSFPDCHESYTLRNNLHWHVKNVHTKSTPQFHCPFCEYFTNRKRILADHLRARHGFADTGGVVHTKRVPKRGKRYCMSRLPPSQPPVSHSQPQPLQPQTVS